MYESFHVSRRRQKACSIVFNESIAPGSVSTECRQAGGHCLECYVAERFRIGRKEKNVGRGICSGEFISIEMTGKAGPRETISQIGAGGAFAYKHAPNPDASRVEPFDYLCEHVQALLPYEPPHESDDNIILIESQAAAPGDGILLGMEVFGVYASSPEAHIV